MGLHHKYIKDRRWYRGGIIFLKRLRFSNEQASVYDVLEVLLHEMKLDSVTKRSSYMAYNFTLSIFPAIIFLFTLIPYIGGQDFNENIIDFLRDFMPPEMFTVTEDTIHDIVNKPRGGLLSVGFLFAVVLSSNGIMALLDSFDKKYKTFKQRSYFQRRVIATILTFVLAFILFISIAAIFFGTYILDALVYYDIVTETSTYALIQVLKYVSVILLFFLANCMIYYYVPAVHDKWPFISAGAVVSTLLIFLVSYLFSLYISNFDTYNHLYGSIGVLVGLMIWLDFVSMILILGFEINIAIDAVTKRLEK